jgi:hypothetical protein
MELKPILQLALEPEHYVYYDAGARLEPEHYVYYDARTRTLCVLWRSNPNIVCNMTLEPSSNPNIMCTMTREPDPNIMCTINARARPESEHYVYYEARARSWPEGHAPIRADITVCATDRHI